jgi:hypothetical protein
LRRQYDFVGHVSAVDGSNFTPFFAHPTMCKLLLYVDPESAGVKVNVTAGSF